MDKVAYEWDVETFDVHGDIIDHNHADKLSEPQLRHWFEFPLADGLENRIVLVRDAHDSNHSGLCQFSRTWAYPENTDENGWQMPAEFDDGSAVPQRFAKEFARNRAWCMKIGDDIDN